MDRAARDACAGGRRRTARSGGPCNPAVHPQHPRARPQAPARLVPGAEGQCTVNTDIAFWADLAFHGNCDGFRIIDITEPSDLQLVSWTHCNGD
jgi:hypothetical protein